MGADNNTSHNIHIYLYKLYDPCSRPDAADGRSAHIILLYYHRRHCSTLGLCKNRTKLVRDMSAVRARRLRTMRSSPRVLLYHIGYTQLI